MSFPRYLALSFATLATVCVAAGCGGDSGDSGVMRVTLGGEGCSYEGSTTPAAGTFAVDVRNDTNRPANFVLMKLPKDATLKDVEAWFHQALRTWRRTGKYVLRPIAWVSNTEVPAHAASELPANVPAGRLAVLCAPGDQPRSDIIAVAALNVTP
jgi:hypothetical protein